MDRRSVSDGDVSLESYEAEMRALGADLEKWEFARRRCDFERSRVLLWVRAGYLEPPPIDAGDGADGRFRESRGRARLWPKEPAS